MKGDNEQQLARLAAHIKGNLKEDAEFDVKQALKSTNSVVVAKAAEAAMALKLTGLTDDIAKLFAAFLQKPGEKDKGCLAKIALARTLDVFEYQQDDLFLEGARLVQLEPAWGPPVDAAADLRAICATALARIGGHEDTLRVLTDLLSDPEPGPRSAAVRNLGSAMASQTSEMLLRNKVVKGDPDIGVLEDCYSALIDMDPEEYYDFVAKSIDPSDIDVARAAGLAIAQSSDRERAFDLLKAHYEEQMEEECKHMLLVPIAMTKTEAAYNFLVSLVKEAPPKRVIACLQALTCYPMNDKQIAALEKAIVNRGDNEITQAYRVSLQF